jgi:hypothetical protein
MPFQINDATAGSQRFAIDNSKNAEIGSATPVAPLSVSGRPIFNGSTLSQSVALPQSMPRITGSVSVSGSATVQTVGVAGFGVIASGGGIYSFASDLTSFSVFAYNPNTAQTLSYGVF